MHVPKVHFIPFFNCHSIQDRTSLKGMDLQEKEKKYEKYREKLLRKNFKIKGGCLTLDLCDLHHRSKENILQVKNSKV